MPPQSWKLHSRGYRLALTLLGLGVVRSRELMLRRRFCLIGEQGDRKSTRLNSSHLVISYAVFCLKKKNAVHLFVSVTCSPHAILPGARRGRAHHVLPYHANVSSARVQICAALVGRTRTLRHDTPA